MATIAVLDNDPGIQSLVVDVLETEGHRTSIVSMTDSPHERLKSEHPDLIILDVWFDDPGDGWRVLRGLKEDWMTRSIPVIIMSGAPQELPQHEQWLSEHDVGILEKPFGIDDLFTRIETALHDSERVYAGTRDSSGRER